MAGYIKLHRGWRDSDFFKGEFSRADAWVWLIENASWKPATVKIKGAMVEIDRGELSFSVRFMAEKWGWSKSRVDRFLAELRQNSMIETRSKIGTTAGHKAGQGQIIISLCNYEKYQGRDDDERDSPQSEIGTKSGQQRDKEEEEKKERIEENTHYAFFGRTIKLNAADLERWRTRYHALCDIKAELGALDDWISREDEKVRKDWFHIVSGSLNKKHQAALRAAAEDEPEDRYLGP